MNKIGDRIKESLKRASIKQKQLAIALRIPEQTISAIIKNRAEPGVYKIEMIANYLGIDLNWLITGKHLEERRKEYKQNIKISGKDIRTGNINIVGEGNIVYERRKDYKAEKMSEIIKKCRKLSPSSRDAVIKIIEVYLDIDNKTKDGSK